VTRVARVLDASLPYELFQRAVGARRVRRALVAEYIRPEPGDRILDAGCGPADILDALPRNVAYLGFDANENYIRTATERWGDRGRFAVARAGAPPTSELDEPFDLVLAIGLLHHLDDVEAGKLCADVPRWLRPGGAFITFDPVLHGGQHRTARWLANNDRGRHVRDEPGYRTLVAGYSDVDASLRTDLLRVPYSHLIMRCRP
jgi:SAM-dependent methyltransferase